MESSKATGVPLSYRLMIKKTGWSEKAKEGANIVYEKDGHFINLAVATDSIALINYTK